MDEIFGGAGGEQFVQLIEAGEGASATPFRPRTTWASFLTSR